MNNFVLTDKGAVIEITNNSTEQIITNNEGFISPTLTPLGNTVSNEIKQAFTIQIPSFVSYKINNIAPGDSISFVVTKPDEVFYYLGVANSKIEGISVTVTPITDDTTLQDKTITPTLEEQVVTADDGYDGLGTVTVEAVTASIDENIVAENIKKDVEILGVTGSYEGSGGGGNATLETTDTEFNYTDNYLSLLTSVEIPNGVTSIGEDSFYECSALTSITIPNSVTSIGSNAFADCSALTSITIPDSVTSIGRDAFFYCSALKSVTIGNSVESIGYNAFTGCSALTSVTISNSVESIGDNAFDNCSALTSVTIGNSVTSIGDYAFANCSILNVIEFLPTTPPELDTEDTFYSLPTECIIYVPNGTLSDYTTASFYPDPSTYTYIERPAT